MYGKHREKLPKRASRAVSNAKSFYTDVSASVAGSLTFTKREMPNFSAYIDAMNAADALLEGSTQEVTSEARRMMVTAAAKLRASVGTHTTAALMAARERAELFLRCERFDQRLRSLT